MGGDLFLEISSKKQRIEVHLSLQLFLLSDTFLVTINLDQLFIPILGVTYTRKDKKPHAEYGRITCTANACKCTIDIFQLVVSSHVVTSENNQK